MGWMGGRRHGCIILMDCSYVQAGRASSSGREGTLTARVWRAGSLDMEGGRCRHMQQGAETGCEKVSDREQQVNDL